MAKKWARCTKCKKWDYEDEVARMGCPACDYRAHRCEDCGGRDGAVRSVLCHIAYWRTRGKMDGGHTNRMRAFANEWTRKFRERAARELAAEARH